MVVEGLALAAETAPPAAYVRAVAEATELLTRRGIGDVRGVLTHLVDVAERTLGGEVVGLVACPAGLDPVVEARGMSPAAAAALSRYVASLPAEGIAEPVVLRDLASIDGDEAATMLAQALIDEGLRSCVVLPLTGVGRRLGAMFAGWTRSMPVEIEDGLQGQMAKVEASVLGFVEGREQGEAAANRLDNLTKLCMSILAAETPAAVVDEAVRVCREVFESDWATVHLAEPGCGELADASRADASGIEHGLTELDEDVKAWARALLRAQEGLTQTVLVAGEVQTLAGTRVRGVTETVGALTIGWKGVRTVGDDEMRALELVARQIGLALGRVRAPRPEHLQPGRSLRAPATRPTSRGG